MVFKNFFSILIAALLSFVCSLALVRLFLLDNNFWQLSIVYFSVLYFSMNLYYASKVNSDEFTQQLLGGIVIKLLMALVVILIFSFSKKDFFSFALHFISHYILFTIFEIRYILLLLKNKAP
jgi:hypothetical protein